jgi:gluconolactonase
MIRQSNFMKILCHILFSMLLAGSFVCEIHSQKIVSNDKRFDKLLPKDAKLEKLTEGYSWVEGPVWNFKESYLLFSDIPNNSIFKIAGGNVSLFLKPSGYTGTETFTGREPGSNGLAFDAEGRLISCEHGDRRISRLEKDGTKTTLADRYEGKRLNSPNDLTFKSNGDLYFTDPPFGLPKILNDPQKELDFQGVYRLSKNRKLTLLTKDLMYPNGIVFSPDEKTLYVSNSNTENAYIYGFAVKKDGTLGEKKIIFDAREMAKVKPGSPDGMKVDKNGYIYAGAPGGIFVINPKDGKLLGTFEFDVPTANCNWGEDGSVLYITSNTAIYRIKLNTKGIIGQVK